MQPKPQNGFNENRTCMVEHQGIVEKISGNRISVRILQQSACSACHAKGVCTAADSKEKIVEVFDCSGEYKINDPVIVEGKESMGYKAVFWAFILPLLILISTLVAAVSFWNFGEMQAVSVSIGALIPYYMILYLLREKMADTFKFTIKKTN